MSEQKTPVLIFAQSGRFLAESATQSGYTAWVADCFGDLDTISIADRWQKILPFNKLSHLSIVNAFAKLTNKQECELICGSGIEICYQLLNDLPNNIRLVGNTLETIHTLKTPSLFFDLLDQLDIAYPSTQFTPPNNIENWLSKSASGLGGQHIQYLTADFHSTNHYFQSYISGASGSCLFLANGKQAVTVSINKQKTSSDKQLPFRLSSIETPWDISNQHFRQLEESINKITAQTHLVGLNSIDFVISAENKLLILEINPRPSASAELIESEIPLFQHHINACRSILPKESIQKSLATSSLHYIFATTNITIPAGMVWPTGCHDLPAEGTDIRENEPMCTVIIQSDDSRQNYDYIEDKINQQLL